MSKYYTQIRGTGFVQFYGISKDPISLNYILIFNRRYIDYLCIKCQIKMDFFEWCKSCKLNHYQLNYGESPSGSNEIDKIIKDRYCESRSPRELIEWTPYDEFKDITHIVSEKSSKLYSASWLNGSHICYWDEDKLTWNRKNKGLKVMLIHFENLDDFDIYKVSYLPKI